MSPFSLRMPMVVAPNVEALATQLSRNGLEEIWSPYCQEWLRDTSSILSSIQLSFDHRSRMISKINSPSDQPARPLRQSPIYYSRLLPCFKMTIMLLSFHSTTQRLLTLSVGG